MAVEITNNTTPCNLGVGCDEAGVCYAVAHGQPEKCGRVESKIDPFAPMLAMAKGALEFEYVNVYSSFCIANPNGIIRTAQKVSKAELERFVEAVEALKR